MEYEEFKQKIEELPLNTWVTLEGFEEENLKQALEDVILIKHVHFDAYMRV